MVPLDTSEFARWRAAADRAAGAASAQAQAQYYEWSCFLYEQAAQLAVKAILHGIGEGPWGHDLAGLVAAAAQSVGREWPADMARPAERLSRFYLPTRYPDALPGGVPGDRFDAEDAAAAAADSATIRSAVDMAWDTLRGDAGESESTR